MWQRFANIMKYVWKNPIVQFACFVILEWVVILFHKSTRNKFKKQATGVTSDACAQDYSVGTDNKELTVKPEEPKEDIKETVVEKPKRIRKVTKKVIVDKVEETKPAKTKRVKKETTDTKKEKTSVKKSCARKKKTDKTKPVEKKK